MKKIIKIIIYIFGFLLLLTILSIIISYSVILVNRVNVYSDKIPKSFNNYKILLLSDLHNRDINKRLVKIIDRENPDVIFLAGDMVDAGKYDNYVSLIKSISNKEIYSIVGNHEQNMSQKEYNELVETIEDYMHIINNEKIVINKNDDSINLYGLSYPLRYYSAKSHGYELSKEDIVTRIGEINKDEYNILLTHNPLFYNAYSEWGSDLTICGHLHGGAIRIPYVGGLLSPDFTFFPKYSSGINKINNMDLIVSKGLGYGRELKLRVNNPGEVVVINLNVK